MTEPNVPTLPYATLADGDAALAQALRRTVAWAAVAYGGGGSASRIYFMALSRKWVSIPVDWGQFTPLQDAFEWSQATGYALLCVAGLLLFRSPSAGIVALRLGLGITLLSIFGEQVYETLREPTPHHFRAIQVLSALTGSVTEFLLIALTLGPVGRALRRA